MRVSEILRSKSNRLVLISSDASLKDASTLILNERVGMVLVNDDQGEIAGTLSERNLICFIAQKGVDAIRETVRSAMSNIGLTAAPADSVTDVMRLMTEKRSRHLPVFDAGKLVGVISIGDILKSRMAEKDQEAAVPRDIARFSLAAAA
ncbi:MAG: CBS domain-containing protein [Sphingomonadales bacterium]|nr:CBS domain-containing protein [Sphingomonadales bacterium]MDE2170305.1 CBS domain-containing protein [Sphingomonadales bacterium]